MVVNKYIITSDTYEGEVVFGYHPVSRLLYGFYCKADLADLQHEFFMQNLYKDEETFLEKFKNSNNLTVKKMPANTTFEKFWNDYGYKVGNKKKSEDIWNKMSIADKVLALEKIPAYKNWLSKKPQTDMVYPERYLSHRRFENEFK
jgi:hypothetical protein